MRFDFTLPYEYFSNPDLDYSYTLGGQIIFSGATAIPQSIVFQQTTQSYVLSNTFLTSLAHSFSTEPAVVGVTEVHINWQFTAFASSDLIKQLHANGQTQFKFSLSLSKVTLSISTGLYTKPQLSLRSVSINESTTDPNLIFYPNFFLPATRFYAESRVTDLFRISFIALNGYIPINVEMSIVFPSPIVSDTPLSVYCGTMLVISIFNASPAHSPTTEYRFTIPELALTCSSLQMSLTDTTLFPPQITIHFDDPIGSVTVKASPSSQFGSVSTTASPSDTAMVPQFHLFGGTCGLPDPPPKTLFVELVGHEKGPEAHFWQNLCTISIDGTQISSTPIDSNRYPNTASNSFPLGSLTASSSRQVQVNCKIPNTYIISRGISADMLLMGADTSGTISPLCSVQNLAPTSVAIANYSEHPIYTDLPGENFKNIRIRIPDLCLWIVNDNFSLVLTTTGISINPIISVLSSPERWVVEGQTIRLLQAHPCDFLLNMNQPTWSDSNSVLIKLTHDIVDTSNVQYPFVNVKVLINQQESKPPPLYGFIPFTNPIYYPTISRTLFPPNNSYFSLITDSISPTYAPAALLSASNSNPSLESFIYVNNQYFDPIAPTQSSGLTADPKTLFSITPLEPYSPPTGFTFESQDSFYKLKSLPV